MRRRPSSRSRLCVGCSGLRTEADQLQLLGRIALFEDDAARRSYDLQRRTARRSARRSAEQTQRRCSRLLHCVRGQPRSCRQGHVCERGGAEPSAPSRRRRLYEPANARQRVSLSGRSPGRGQAVRPKITRDCAEQPFCLEVPVGFRGVDIDADQSFVFRAYLEPGRSVSSAPEELLIERVLHVH
jgi:hypothetical protein